MTGLTVRDVMAPDPLFVFPETEIVEATLLMRKLAVRELVVLSSGRVVGIVTYSDFVTRYVAEGHDVVLIGSIMTPNPYVVAPEDALERAARLMIEHGIGRLPVCGGTGLAGLIRREDLPRLGGCDELFCLLGRRPPERASEGMDLPRAIGELDTTLEHVRELRREFREVERALRTRRHRLTLISGPPSVA